MPGNRFPVSGHLAKEVRTPTDDMLAKEVSDTGDDATLRENVPDASISQVGGTDGVGISSLRDFLGLTLL